MAYNNIFLDSLLWMTPYNALPKSGGRTTITFSFGQADTYAIYGPDFRQDKPQNTIPWLEATAWDGLTDLFPKADSSGRYTLANGIQIDLGGRKGAQAAVYVALRMWSDIANIDVKQTSPFNADTKDKPDFKFLVTSKMRDYVGDDSTGAFAYQPINYSDKVKYTNLGGKYSPGYAVFDQLRWNTDLVPGTEGFYTISHEIGHLFGLDHPFYDGGGAAEPTVPEIFETGPGSLLTYQFDDGAGYIASPGAFDIAAMHALYGANMAYKTGNDVYKLPTTNSGWFCLWDAAGVDTIDASDGAKAATIDLRSATLDESDLEGAAGRISKFNGVLGGFTIAKDAQIENAIGGNLGDSIHGNAFANKLDGRSGADTIQGGVGADTLIGGLGADLFVFTNLHDFRDRVGPYSARADDYIQDFNANEDKLDFSDFDADPAGSRFDPKSFVFLGTRTNANQLKFSKSGAAELIFDATTKSLIGDINADGLEDLTIRVDSVSGVAGASQLTKQNFIMRDTYYSGTEGNDSLRGCDGNDTLLGGAGADTMTGGWGRDIFKFTSLTDFRSGQTAAVDRIDDFVSGVDRLDFTSFDVDPSAVTTYRQFRFIGGAAFQKGGGAQLRFDAQAKILAGDVDANESADFYIVTPGVASMSKADFIGVI